LPSRPRLALIVSAACVLTLAAGPAAADAAQRFASPSGTGTTCTQATPCDLSTAITGAAAGDEAILISNGTPYVIGGAGFISVPSGVEVHGEDGQSRPVIQGNSIFAPLIPSGAGIVLRHLNFQNSGPAVQVTSGATVRDVTAISTNAGTFACLFGGDGVLTDAVCIATNPTNSTGVGANLGNSLDATLRNVTAVGGAFGIDFSVSADPAPSSVDAKNVIAIGPVDVRGGGSAPSSISVDMAHSNYDTTQAAGLATVTPAGTGSNQTAAPAFINAAGNDYRQAAGSPTIDAGTLDSQNGPVDLDGEDRDQGLVPDIGADEFTNTPPTASGDSVAVAEDAGATAVDALANDVDPDGAGPVIRSVAQPANGTATITGGGTGLTYEPDPDYCNDGGSPDQFVYTLNGGSQGIVSATVTCVGDAPVAVDDSATVDEDDPAAALGVTGNDTDADGDPVTVSSITAPDHGSATIAAGGGDVEYEPDPDYCGPDSFTYTLNGGDTGTVSVSVTCVDDAPVAVGDSATMPEGAGLTPIDVLANDTDIDGGTKAVASNTAPAHGSANVAAGGTGVTYQPGAGYCGPDSFSYSLNGGSSATVSITVTCAPDTAAPNTSFGKKPANTTRNRRAKFRFRSTEAGSKFACKLDRKPFRPCPATKTFVVRPGRHTLRVRATDAAGNVDRTPAIYRWRVLPPRR
jgi:Bacterial Ig domain/Bacterial cadherin-like domain